MSSLRVGYAQVPSFYASVERLDDPGLRARPVVVGGNPHKRGKVQSASGDALDRGVTLGMWMEDVPARCPDAALVRTNMKRYREVSAQLLVSLREATAGIEVAGLAGGFFEVPDAARHDARRARTVAEGLIDQVRASLGLSLRVGIAPVKFLARLVAAAPDGDPVVCVAEEQVATFLAPLALNRLPGVGAKTRAILREMNVETVGQLRALPRRDVERRLGRQAHRILPYANGQDASLVRVAAHPKTMSFEHTLEHAVRDRDAIGERLATLCQNAASSLRQQHLQVDCVAIKLRYDDASKIVTRRRTLQRPLHRGADLYTAAFRLLDKPLAGLRPVALVGVGLAGLAKRVDQDSQLDLFGS